MKKIILFLFIVVCFSLFSECHSANWLVGPTRIYTKPSLVSSLVQPGDTVSIDAGTYTADVCKWSVSNLFLRGVGGMAHLNANNTAFGQKGIWVIAGNNTRVEYVEFSHSHDVSGLDMNWAGIRQEGRNLTVRHCYFHDNDNGILAGTVNPSNMIIEFTEFEHNGYGDGYSHNLYINHIDTLIFQYNYSHHATIGHELKSRAHVNYILYNRFSNEGTGDASRELDLPDGGVAIVIGNIIEQGLSSTNSGIIGYGLESLANTAPHEFYLINNTVVNDKSNGTFISISSGTGFFKAYNNIFAGNGTWINGNALLVDSASNWRINNIASVGFINTAGYDYHLTSTSQAINKGANPGTANNGSSLTPILEYSHPANSVAKVISGVIDIGAHEFASTTSIAEVSVLKDLFDVGQVEGVFFINSEVQGYDLKIYDLTGKEILFRKELSGNMQLSIVQFYKGVYLFEIKSKGGIVCGKFVL